MLLVQSTSTEITYPFSVVKLIINPSRQGIFPELGFRISGGHSSPNCMEVTARIEQIDKRHRNYQVLANTVDEGVFHVVRHFLHRMIIIVISLPFF